MFMRITWGQLQPGAWDPFMVKYHEVADPATPGLLARWVVQDTNNTDSMFAITLWDTRESIRAWETSDDYRGRFLPAVEPFMIGSYSVSVSEVRYACPPPPPG